MIRRRRRTEKHASSIVNIVLLRSNTGWLEKESPGSAVKVLALLAPVSCRLQWKV